MRYGRSENANISGTVADIDRTTEISGCPRVQDCGCRLHGPSAGHLFECAFWHSEIRPCRFGLVLELMAGNSYEIATTTKLPLIAISGTRGFQLVTGIGKD